jgi:hypothetical protein
MLRDELTQKSMKVKMVFGFGYPRACRFRKTKLINQYLYQYLYLYLYQYLYQLFSKRDFYFIKRG